MQVPLLTESSCCVPLQCRAGFDLIRFLFGVGVQRCAGCVKVTPGSSTPDFFTQQQSFCLLQVLLSCSALVAVSRSCRAGPERRGRLTSSSWEEVNGAWACCIWSVWCIRLPTLSARNSGVDE